MKEYFMILALYAIIILIVCIVYLLLMGGKKQEKKIYHRIGKQNLWEALLSDVHNITFTERHKSNAYFDYKGRYDIAVMHVDSSNPTTAVFNKNSSDCVLCSFNKEMSEKLAKILIKKM